MVGFTVAINLGFWFEDGLVGKIVEPLDALLVWIGEECLG